MVLCDLYYDFQPFTVKLLFFPETYSPPPLCRTCKTSRHRIVSVSAPRIATQYPPDGQPTSFQRAVFSDSLKSVFRACRGKTACGHSERGYAELIELYQHHERERRHLFYDPTGFHDYSGFSDSPAPHLPLSIAASSFPPITDSALFTPPHTAA